MNQVPLPQDDAGARGSNGAPPLKLKLEIPPPPASLFTPSGGVSLRSSSLSASSPATTPAATTTPRRSAFGDNDEEGSGSEVDGAEDDIFGRCVRGVT